MTPERSHTMRKNFGAKPILYPQPVFIIATYNEDGTANAMNAAWGGISESNQITMCIGDNHRTARNVMARKAFTVSMATAEYVPQCDYVGIVSGDDVPDKLTRCGFHTSKSAFVDAPLIDELPMAVECKLLSYDTETCCMIGEVVNVCAEESVLTDGKIDPQKLRPITFDGMNHTYLALGEKVGNAFSDGNKLK